MGSTRILVADDDAWILRMVMTVLEKRGYDVVTAADGEEAFEKAVANPPNLVITDVMMPNMDGWALIKALRARPEFAFIPVIFLTALSGDDDRIRGFRLGADDFLSKPFRFEELDLRVAKTLERTHRIETLARKSIGAAPPSAAATTSEKKRAITSEVRALNGDLEEVGLSALLTLLEMERKTGTLTVEQERGSLFLVGRIYLRQGRVICAEIDGHDEPRNAECVYSLLEWISGSFEFLPGDSGREDEIAASTSYLLIEGARRLDEAHEAANVRETQ